MPQTDTSWWDRLVAGLSGRQEVPPPPRPSPPKVDEKAWARNVEQARISPYLGTVHDLGLIVFGETQSYTDRPDSNEPIVMARQKLAHSIINADQKWGTQRIRFASTHGAVEPPERVLINPAARAAYESSIGAAREAFLSGGDPTNGAVFAIAKKSPARSNHIFTGPGARPDGVPISTQSGPYNNSYLAGDMPSSTAWLNTYLDK
jgi:hypothetical protein